MIRRYLLLVLLGTFSLLIGREVYYQSGSWTEKTTKQEQSTIQESDKTPISVSPTVIASETQVVDTISVYDYTDACEIGYTNNSLYDDLTDNVHVFSLDKEEGVRYYLVYSIKSDTGSVVMTSVNEDYAHARIVEANEGTVQNEVAALNWDKLRQGTNTLRFSPQAWGAQYTLQGIKVYGIRQDKVEGLVVNQAISDGTGRLYLSGYAGSGVDNVVLGNTEIDIKRRSQHFEVILPKGGDNSTALLTYTEGTQEYDLEVPIEGVRDFKNYAVEPINTDYAINSNSVQAGEVRVYDISGELSMAGGSVERTRSVDQARLPEGMIGVCPLGRSYRFLPHGTILQDSITVGLPFDVDLLPSESKYQSIRPYYFDEEQKEWTGLSVDSIDLEGGYVYFRTDHFTDYINGVIVAPSNPEQSAFSPVTIQDAAVAAPLEEQNIMQVPYADQYGGANAVFPIEVPAGRGGLTPSVALSYNSNGKEGWVGYGWSLEMPSIKVETRWGMPVFDAGKETEQYSLNGKALIYEDGSLPNRHKVVSGAYITERKDRNTSGNKIFYQRQSENFARIERLGNAPTDYSWKVTQTDGSIYYYGGSSSSIQKVLDGNIAEWFLSKVVDRHGNEMIYNYVQDHNLHEIKISSIEYGGWSGSVGKYKIDFESYDHNVYFYSDSLRQDTRSNHNYGVTLFDGRLLRGIKVSYNSQPIRGYKMEYDTIKSPFGKTLLETIVEKDVSGDIVSSHSFEYYDDILENNNVYYSDPEIVTISCPDQPITNDMGDNSDTDSDGIINALDNYSNYYNPLQENIPSSTSENANASSSTSIGCPLNTKLLQNFGVGTFDDNVSLLGLSRNSSARVGGGLNIGFGFNILGKGGTFTINGNGGYSSGQSNSHIAMIDMNGDGLSDMVYHKGNELWYMPHIISHVYTPTGFNTEHSYGSEIKLSNISRFMLTKTENYNVSGTASIGSGGVGGNAGIDRSFSSSKTKVYITDANSDGLPDIGVDGRVYFNHIENNVPTFTTASEPTENMILFSGGSIDSMIIDADPFENEEISLPKHDIVKVWEAPSDGSINIENLNVSGFGETKLSIETDNNGLYGYPQATVKGVCRLWHGTQSELPQFINAMPPSEGLNCQGAYVDPCTVDSDNNGILDCLEFISGCMSQGTNDTINISNALEPLDTLTIYANHLLNADNDVQASAVAVYRAGRAIVFNPGFYAHNSSLLTACIELCKGFVQSQVYTEQEPNPTPAIRVKKGQKIYFRTHSSDTISPLLWDPKVSFNSVNGNIVDTSRTNYQGRKVFTSSYKNAFLLNKKSPTILPGKNGDKFNIGWQGITFPNVKDDIEMKVTKIVYLLDKSNAENDFQVQSEDVIYQASPTAANNYTLSDQTFSNIEINQINSPTIQSFTALYFELKSNVEYDWGQISWQPKITYNNLDNQAVIFLNPIFPVVSKSIYKEYTPPFDLNQGIKSPHYNSFIINNEPKIKDYYLHHHTSIAPNTLCNTCPDGQITIALTEDNTIIYKNKMTLSTSGGVTYDNTMPFHLVLDTINPKSYELNLYADTSYISDLFLRRLQDRNPVSHIAVLSEQSSINDFNDPDLHRITRNDINLYSESVDVMGHFFKGWGQFIYVPNFVPDSSVPSDTFSKLIYLEDLTSIRDSTENIKSSLEDYYDRLKNNINDPDSVEVIINAIENGSFAPKRHIIPATPVIQPLDLQTYTNTKEKWVGIHNEQYADEVGAVTACASIIVDNAINEPPIVQYEEADANTGAICVNKVIKGNASTLHFGISVNPLHNVSFTKTLDASSVHLVDYLDFNGDGYPDIVYKDSLILTNSFGGLGGLSSLYQTNTILSNNDVGANVGFNENNESGISSSGVFPILRHTSSVTGSTSKSSASTDVSQSLTFSGAQTSGTNTVHLSYDHIDNDGILDREYKNTLVLSRSPSSIPIQDLANIKYDSGHQNRYIKHGLNMPSIFTDQTGKMVSESSSAGLGIQLFPDNSFSLGLSLGESSSGVTYDRIDINGDGYKDYIYRDSAFTDYKVLFNAGGHRIIKQSRVINYNGLNLLAMNTSSSNTESTSGTLDFPFFGAKWGGSLSGTFSRSVSRTKTTFQDYNGDGYPDLLRDIGDNRIEVRYAMVGRSNKLKSITTSVGGKYEVDYRVSAPTYDDPYPKWNVSKIKVIDTHNQAVQGPGYTTKYYRFHNARYDRRERTSLGYEVVRTIDLNIPDDDANNTPESFEENILRQKIDIYHNKNIHLQGKLKESYVAKDSVAYSVDAGGQYSFTPTASQLLSKTTTSYELRQLNPTAAGWRVSTTVLPMDYDVGGTKGLGASYCLMTEQRTRNYESDQYLEQVMGWGYDSLGRVKSYTHNNGEYTTTITYKNTPALLSKNLIQIPDQIEVREGSTLKRRRSNGSVNPATGDVLSMSTYDGSALRTVTMTYDSYGNIETITTPPDQYGKSATTTLVYDTDMHQYVTETSHSYDGQVYTSSQTWDYRFGKPLTATDISGHTYTYTYDDIGRMTQCLHPREAGANQPYTYRFTYDNLSSGRRYALTELYDEDNSSRPIHIYTLSDGLGRIVQTQRDYKLGASGLGLSVSGIQKMDYLGRVIEAYQPTSLSGSAVVDFSTVLSTSKSMETYDIKDRPLVMTDAASHTTTYTYSIANSRLKTHVAVDNGSYSTDYETASYTDNNGRLRKQEQLQGTTQVATQYMYDGIGQQTQVTSADGKTISYTYNEAGELTMRTHPDAGTTRYTYDLLGHMKSKKTQQLYNDGTEIHYTYDALGRARKIDYPDLVSGIPSHNNTKYGYYGTGSGYNTGRMEYVIDASGMTRYTYDETGSVASETKTMGKGTGVSKRTFVTQYDTDSWGRLQQIIYPDGEEVRYGYGYGGDLQQVIGKYGTPQQITLVSQIEYNHFGERTAIVYGNGKREDYSYDNPLRRLESYQLGGAGSTLLTNSYTYDYVGNIKTITNTAGNTTLGGAYNHAYSYDNAGRLTSGSGSWSGAANAPSGYSTASYNVGVQYDAMYRIDNLSRSLTQGSNTSSKNYDYQYTNTVHPRAVSRMVNNGGLVVEGFQYDANGNMVRNYDTSIYDKRMTWDPENRMRTHKHNTDIAHYVYDSQGNRVMKGLGTMNGSVSISGYTLYPSGYMTLTKDDNITKHYYMGSKRIASRMDVDHNFNQNHLSHPDFGDPNDGISWDVLLALSGTGGGSASSLNAPPSCATSYPANSEAYLQCDCYTNNNCPQVLYYYHSDHLGSSTYITTSGGNEYQFLQYLPYGGIFVEQKDAGLSVPYLFNSYEADDESGFYYAKNRYYNPEFGVFNSVDLLSDHPNQVGMSPYSAMWGNPINYSDPDGLCPECPEDANVGDTYMWGGAEFTYNVDGWSNELGAVTITPDGGSGNGVGLSINNASEYSKDFKLGQIITSAGGAALNNRVRGQVSDIGLGTTYRSHNANNYTRIRGYSGGVDGYIKTGVASSRTGKMLIGTSRYLGFGAMGLGTIGLGVDYANVARGKESASNALIRTGFFGASIYTGAAMGGPWGAAAGFGIGTMGEGVIMVKDKIVPKVRNKLKQAHGEYNRWLNWRYGRR